MGWQRARPRPLTVFLWTWQPVSDRPGPRAQREAPTLRVQYTPTYTLCHLSPLAANLLRRCAGSAVLSLSSAGHTSSSSAGGGGGGGVGFRAPLLDSSRELSRLLPKLLLIVRGRRSTPAARCFCPVGARARAFCLLRLPPPGSCHHTSPCPALFPSSRSRARAPNNFRASLPGCLLVSPLARCPSVVPAFASRLVPDYASVLRGGTSSTTSMDSALPDGKRPRLSSWSASTAQPVSLPHLHTAPRPHPPYQPSYPPHSADHASPSASAPSHGHAHQHHTDLDRRHHDQETLAPMQDPYRPPPPQQPPSPARPHPYHQYPSRDSVVKRETGDELRRPNSTGHAPESLPATASAPQPPAPLQPSPYAAESQPRHMSYDNGPPGPPPAAVYRPPSFPPTPSHQSSYEPHAGYTSAAEPFYSVYTSASAAKKKNTRASQV